MPQTVHLQYNSPMGLYSKEAAVEQFEQQIGTTPGDLPAQDKHFDPSRSATLKYLKEAEKDDGFGANFFEKVAQAEAPNVPYQQEPNWARTAREKSERARSKTPADPTQGYYAASSPIPTTQYPGHLAEAKEHAEKNRVFTNNLHQPWGPSYHNSVQHHHRSQRSKSLGRETTPRGYELGGIDYTQGLHVDHGTDYNYYEYPQQKPVKAKPQPGYELGGTDFYKGYISHDGNYRGHGPDPPRLRSKYTADAHDPCNVAVAPNLDQVDANLLVGDTLSNQKIRHEVRHIDQSEFGTAFGPSQGFKRDHHTVRRSPAPQQPPTFSISANRNYRAASAPRSSAPPEQGNVWRDTTYNNEKEVSIRTLLNDDALRAPKRETTPTWVSRSHLKSVAWNGRVDPLQQRYQTYVNEPNWRRNVDQRRQAWEKRAFETEHYLNRPYHEKVGPTAAPAWQNRAEHTHQQWKQQADNMNTSQTHTIPVNYTTYGSEESNAAKQINSGFNSNQVDYVNSHKNNYTQGPHYHPHVNQPTQQSQNYQSYNYSSNNHSATVPRPSSQSSNYQSHEEHNSSKKTTTITHFPQFEPLLPLKTLEIDDSNFKKEFEAKLHSPLSKPVQIVQAGTFAESNYSKNHSTHTTTTTTQPAYQPVNNQLNQSYNRNYHTETHTTTTTPQYQPVNHQQNQNYNRSYHTETHTTTTNPVQPPVSYQPSLNQSNQNYNRSYHTETHTTTTNPAQAIALPQGGQNYSTSYHTESHSVQPPQTLHSPGGQSFRSSDFSSSHYKKNETTTRTISQPTFHTQTQPITKNVSYNYSSQDVTTTPAQPIINQESFTSHTQKTSNTVQQPRLAPSSYYENYSSNRREENRREETVSRPVSQLSQYSESRNYKRNYEEKTETTTVPAGAATTTVSHNDISNAKNVDDVFNKKTEMLETLPLGSVFNTHNNTEGGYRDVNGHDVSYKRETQTAADPGREVALLKEEEKRVVETPLEPGVISRHVTTKYYKKKTVTDTTTTTAPA